MQDISAPAHTAANTVINEVTGETEVRTPAAVVVAEVKPELNEAEAKTKTERLIKMRDMLQSRALGYASGDINAYEQFEMEKWEFDWLVEVYTDTIRSVGYIPKWLDILIAEMTVLGFKIAKVFKVRKLKAENEQLKADKERMMQERQQMLMQMHQMQQQNRQSAPQPVETTQNSPASPVSAVVLSEEMPLGRKDFKKYWQIDAQGRFVNAVDGVYLSEDKRTDIEGLTPGVIALLIKYNGADKVNKLFDLEIDDDGQA